MRTDLLKSMVSILMSIFIILLTMPSYLAAQPDGAAAAEVSNADTYASMILKTIQKADSVLAYLENLIGDQAHQVSQTDYDALKTESERLRGLLDTEDPQAIQNQISVVEAGILQLLSESEGEEGGRVTPVPKSSMTVMASSFSPDYPPANAIDGRTDTFWHTAWLPETTPLPHSFTIELDRARVLNDLSILPRQDGDGGKITLGQIYAGSSPDTMELVTEFTGDTTRDATVIDLKRTEAKYIEIRSLETTIAHTVISEINLNAFESDVFDVAQGAMQISANTYNTDYPPENAIDGNPGTFWHTEWMPESAPFPHILTIELNKSMILHDISISPRQDGGGEITAGQIYAGNSPDAMTLVTDFTGDGSRNAIVVDLADTEAKYVQICSLATTGTNTVISEIGISAVRQSFGAVAVPKSMMTASANTFNASYAPEKAVDNDAGTFWHSEWTPQDAPFPHILTIRLDKKMILNDITIAPRQDANAGKITSGQIYAGDSLDDMRLITDFTGDTTQNASIVDLEYVTAKYIQIYSLATSGTNTTVSEVDITTFDRGIVGAFSSYDYAADLIRKAIIGTEIGNFSAEDVAAFEAAVDQFYNELGNDALLPNEYYAIKDRIDEACAAFLAKAKAYSKEDLAGFIQSLTELTARLEIPEDKASAEALLEQAGQTYASPDAAKPEIHKACVLILDFIKTMDATDSDTLDLSGEWRLGLDSYSSDMELPDTVSLPGTLDTNKKGTYNPAEDIQRLSRYYKYTGPAVYQKDVYISQALAGKQIELFMERTRVTRVWVNGTEVFAPETSNALPVSQSYDLSANIQYGAYNEITIVVDNSYPDMPANAIKNSHMATDETQTNWNGILGRFVLQIHEPVFIDDIRVYPNEDLKSATVEADIRNTSDADWAGTLALNCGDAGERALEISLAAGEAKTFTIPDYAMPENVRLWSEFDTPLYTMHAALPNGSSATAEFGMRVFEGDGAGAMQINGNKVFLRGEANCAVFPLTGYAPMDEASWESLFSTYKSYGINAVRFHSWCPPEAAFQAADRLGLYLQPELSCWDSPMLGDEIRRNYYTKEAFAIIREYANHPSFVMLSFGNEVSYNGDDYTVYGDKLVSDLKATDPTRLYAPGSNIAFGGAAPSPSADFFTAQQFGDSHFRGSYGGLGGFVNQSYPSGMVNYDNVIEQLSGYGLPSFSFEVGQYQVFPDLLTETQRYTGILDARNFKQIAQKAEAKGLSEEDIRKAIEASGMLSRIGYKAEIEAVLRTSGMSGISLLGIQDFSGQGTALVGMMNAFGETKPYDFADPEAFSEFFSPVVPLLQISKFCFTNSETLTGELLLSNYSNKAFSGAVHYTLSYADGTVFFEGDTDSASFPQGELTSAGEISIPLNAIAAEAQMTLTLSCQDGRNSYNLWVYPDSEPVSDGEVYIAEYLDDTAMDILENGGKVFLSPRASAAALPQSREGRFSTAFWSTYDQNQPGTMGLLLDPAHPLFETFPTEYHSDYQWWAMAKLGRPMNLDDLTNENGERLEPLVKVLDGFEKLENLSLLYEAKVGNGSVVVSSMGLEQLKTEYPEAMALRNAILRYMNSENFNPDFEISAETINQQVVNISGDNQNNLAYGKPVTVSNEMSAPSTWSKENLTDGIVLGDGGWTTEIIHETDLSSSPVWIEIDLEQDTDFDLIKLYPRNFLSEDGVSAAGFPRDFEIQIKADGETSFTTVRKITDSTTTPNAPVAIPLDALHTARYVKIQITSQGAKPSGDWPRVQLNEVMIFNTSAADPAQAVIDQIDALGEITSLDQKAEVEAARVAYNALTDAQKALVTNYSKLEAAEQKIQALSVRPGDLDGDGEVTVSDVVELRKLIVRGSWTEREFTAGNLDNTDSALTVSDVVALRALIVSGA